MRRGRQFSSAINRRPAAGAIHLNENGFADDQVSDQRVHGGPEKAACVFPLEHYAFFASRLGRELAPPSFGENLTCDGLLEEVACIGDVYAIGTTHVQITSPRQPCLKLALKHDAPDLPRWIVETGYSGFYLRVLSAGAIETGAAIELVERPNPRFTVAEVQRLRYARRPAAALLRETLALGELSASYRDVLERRAAGESGWV